MSEQQAYAGNARYEDGNSEFNRLSRVVRSILNKSATATIVQVVAVDGERVDVNPMVAQMDGANNAIPHGTVHDLPIWRPFGGGNGIILPITAGDIGIAVFAHTDISSVKDTMAPANPGSRRRFDYADGMYLGGILNAEPKQQLAFAEGLISLIGTASIVLDAPTVSTTGELQAGNGATGSFTSQDGKTITVAAGIVTGIA